MHSRKLAIIRQVEVLSRSALPFRSQQEKNKLPDSTPSSHTHVFSPCSQSCPLWPPLCSQASCTDQGTISFTHISHSFSPRNPTHRLPFSGKLSKSSKATRTYPLPERLVRGLAHFKRSLPLASLSSKAIQLNELSPSHTSHGPATLHCCGPRNSASALSAPHMHFSARSGTGTDARSCSWRRRSRSNDMIVSFRSWCGGRRHSRCSMYGVDTRETRVRARSGIK